MPRRMSASPLSFHLSCARVAISSFLVSGRMSEVSAIERKWPRQSFLRFYFIPSSLIFVSSRKPLIIFFALQVNPYEFYSACKKTRALKEAFRFSRLAGRKLLRNYSMLLSVCAQAQDASGEKNFSFKTVVALKAWNCGFNSCLVWQGQPDL